MGTKQQRPSQQPATQRPERPEHGADVGRTTIPTEQDRAWNDPSRRDMHQGDRTRPPQPDGTTPLKRDERPIDQSR